MSPSEDMSSQDTRRYTNTAFEDDQELCLRHVISSSTPIYVDELFFNSKNCARFSSRAVIWTGLYSNSQVCTRRIIHDPPHAQSEAWWTFWINIKCFDFIFQPHINSQMRSLHIIIFDTISLLWLIWYRGYIGEEKLNFIQTQGEQNMQFSAYADIYMTKK